MNAAALQERLQRALGAEFELLRPLGQGGMATVFLAREAALNRLVAIKVLDPELGASPVFRSRFQREAEMAASLQHPNVVPIHRVGAAGELSYIVMSYV
ncbi:MAG TPA: protein kinase, partial [Gemmatimonadales bacterium]|nr:protein kinase [Gemmatimonadales bacterium]